MSMAVFLAFAAQLQLPTRLLLGWHPGTPPVDVRVAERAPSPSPSPSPSPPSTVTKRGAFVSLSSHLYTMPYTAYFAALTASLPPDHWQEE